MAERQSIDDFATLCGGEIDGYTLREGQEHPETFEELVVFLAERVGMPEDEFSVQGLSMWLLEGRQRTGSCSPELDSMHVETVILIGELTDADNFVASLPEAKDAVWLPPTNIVRIMLAEQARTI